MILLGRVAFYTYASLVWPEATALCFLPVSPSVLWNQLPDSFRQPHHSRLDSPPHLLLNSSVIIPTLVIHHSFTPYSKPTFSTNPSTVDFFYLLDCLTITGLDRTYHAHHFIFSFNILFFLFIPCGRLSWLPVSFLLHVK